jgi:hypothetical protein
MPKQNNSAGLGSAGPHKQGEKGGKGGTTKAGAGSDERTTLVRAIHVAVHKTSLDKRRRWD